MGIIEDGAKERMQTLHTEIVALDREINKVQNEYKSLLRFRDSVSHAQNNFNEANDHRRLVLRDLDSVRTNNTVVQKYQDGMGNQLTGIGMKVVDGAFVGLQVMIGLKLTEYWNRIRFLEQIRFNKEFEYNSLDIVF